VAFCLATAHRSPSLRPDIAQGRIQDYSRSRGRGEDGTEFSPFASVLGPAGAERCQAGHVALPALRPRSSLPSFGHPTLFNEFQSPACTFVISATKSNRGPSSRIFSEFPKPFNVGVVPWGSAIQKFEKRSLDLDGSTKSKNKAGHSGKDLSIACNAARYAGPRSKIKIERLNERNHVCNSYFRVAHLWPSAQAR
jgi:hypothetical protein